MPRRTYKGPITRPEDYPPSTILVGGTNTQGRHGLGIALIGRQRWGAIFGQASGYQGRFYGLVTKDLTKRNHPSIPENQMIDNIIQLYRQALINTQDHLIPYTAYSSNLNGYSALEMASFFSAAGKKYGTIPENIIFEESFLSLIEILNT